MKIERPILTACMLALSVLPLAADAAKEKDALQSCAQALHEKLQTKAGYQFGLEVDEESLASNRNLSAYQSYTLIAKNAKTNKVIAKADCAVNSRGKVRRLSTLPLAALPPGTSGEQMLAFNDIH